MQETHHHEIADVFKYLNSSAFFYVRLHYNPYKNIIA